MKNLILKLFTKPYNCSMELHKHYGCYVSPYQPADYSESLREFFKRNHFLIAHNMFDENWDEKTQLEEIYKKLLLIYQFDPNNQDIIIVYKNHKKVYLPNGFYVPLPQKSVFVYDKGKIKVIY